MSFSWVSSSPSSSIPQNACLGGNDSDGTAIYVGRTTHAGDQLPAKVIPAKRTAYIAYGSSEIQIHHYEILCGMGFSWIPSSNGNVPPHAVSGGRTRNNETLYIGRAHHERSLTPGKIHTSHKCLYIPYGGREIKKTSYEVLCQQPISQWTRASGHTIPYGAIVGGHDSDGSQIYVGRAFYSNEHLPAKVIPSKSAAYVSFNGGEHQVPQYEILCNGNTRWENYHGQVPHNAVPGGRTASGEKLYIGRGTHHRSLTVGKIHPSHGCLYIPYGGSEISIRNTFEVLVEN